MNREQKGREQRFPVWSSVLIGSFAVLFGIAMVVLTTIAISYGSGPSNPISTYVFAAAATVSGICLMSMYFINKKTPGKFPISHILIYGIAFSIAAITAIIESVVTKNSDTINTIMYTFEFITGIICIASWIKYRDKSKQKSVENSVDESVDAEFENKNNNTNEEREKE